MLAGSRRSSIFIVPSGKPKNERLNSCRIVVENVYEVGRDEQEGREMIVRKTDLNDGEVFNVFVTIIIMRLLFNRVTTL